MEQQQCLETLKFSSGNPRVETTRGWMHLLPHSPGEFPACRREILCIPEVPSHMSGTDFCQFTGSFLQDVKEMRIVWNDAGKDKYSVLMTFENQSSADSFFKYFDNKPFSSFEAETCRVRFVADVHLSSSNEQASSATGCGLADFPTCPVCLERLDQYAGGILVTVCNHSFHSYCLSKWTDSSCPVCRYCQQKCENSTCSVCSTTENLWICVICGYVGCGRLTGGHALRHWEQTQHCYSLELETQRVWDYAGDNYVHRLVQSKTDGKPVELNAACHDASDAASCECIRGTEFDEAVTNSKIEAVKSEYDHLLSVQLESQRQYYEGLIAQALQSREATLSRAVEKSVSTKLHKMHQKLAKAEEKKTILEQTNKCLQENQQTWKEKFLQLEERQKLMLKERDDKVADLQEQVRDLMVFIQAQNTIQGNSEMLGGTVITMPSDAGQNKGRSRPKGKSGRKKK